MRDQLLKGIRVLDFGSFLAGPVSTMLLATLGAEVIKVENPKKPDGSRFFVTAKGVAPPDYRIGSQLYDTSNFNKLDLSIDLSTDEGRAILMDLVKETDIVMENMSPGAMGRLGFSYEECKKVNKEIVYCSSSACGQFGPERNFKGYAATFAVKSGLGHITGYEDSKPSTFVGSIDNRSATHAIVAMLAALCHVDMTGEGQYIDIASQEAISAQLGDVYIDYAANGNNQIRQGNKRPGFAPQGAYKCIGEEKYVTISVETEEQWVSLCNVIGKPELAADSRFATYEARYDKYDELDAILNDWAKDKKMYDAVELLQAEGVPSGPVLNSEGVFRDPHLSARETFVEIPHREMGTDYAIRSPWIFSETPAGASRTAPLLGEHTTQLLKNILNYDDEKINDLASRKIIRRTFD
ncbi:Crotonobetainyl-CoA:carnitine CoA-transferase CaiB [Dethiosulfatibacter aminovorans DSM 17477]|uniref:Crotonobetainyl-CoA:carnitine CoA-transferase CaiB n=1 Tax=Dethiosulfatibacter aminovorans DSM 17477 TaxID=1121476 RepID=A0A1M6EYC5_9FIRM|nr:CaiB/BaiF CoA-transferase family protein [Dethiosulfatibacter aminovorans]SHI90468.1 Crotonobetainyl-CoA:carnitine CoA-transferase CaiB [Dethiosulfatibacter aminovorans DSM 17477]